MFDTRKCALRSHHGPSRPVAPPVVRMPSIRVIDSTWITSAPRAASTPVPAGPAHHAVRSSTRTPASGSPAAPGAGSTRSGTRVSIAPVCSPRRGAGRGGGGSVSWIRHGRRGIVNESVGSRTSTLRATKWGMAVIVSPLPTGATGIRSSIARSTISAVSCFVVNARTISFHSALRETRPTRRAQLSSPSRSRRSMSTRKLSNC